MNLIFLCSAVYLLSNYIDNLSAIIILILIILSRTCIDFLLIRSVYTLLIFCLQMPSNSSFFECQLDKQIKLSLWEKFQLPILIDLPLMYPIPFPSLSYITSSKVGSRSLVIPYCNRFQALESRILIPVGLFIKSGFREIKLRPKLLIGLNFLSRTKVFSYMLMIKN